VTIAGAAILVAGGLVAGIVNTLAGGASILSVPLLVLVGLPGTVANGTNQVGILTQNVVATWRFGAEGVPGIRHALPVLIPIGLGSLLGASAISFVGDQTFERLFGVVMLALLFPMLLGTPRARAGGTAGGTARWPPAVSFLVFLGIGLYGGAFQAGVGILLVIALSWAGHDLVQANSIKVVVNAALTAVAVPVFVVRHQIAWVPALVLAVGFVGGGIVGVRLAVSGGERVIRPVLAASVVGLAGRMLGLY
jgi:uncharacterized membrane protein YfcA